DAVASVVEVMDVAGGVYGSEPTIYPSQASASLFADEPSLDAFDDVSDRDVWQTVLDHLAACDGIVYLFDPLRSEPYDYFQRTLEQLTRRSYENGRLLRGRLPQFLAVCVTKFDNPSVFRRAQQAGLIATGTDARQIPTVPGRLAAEFFQRLCADR